MANENKTNQIRNITVRPGLPWKATLRFKDNNKTPLSMSGHQFKGQVWSEPKGDFLAEISFDLTDIATGVIVASLTGDQTVRMGYLRLKYDIVESSVVTSPEGNFSVDDWADARYIMGGEVILLPPNTEVPQYEPPDDMIMTALLGDNIHLSKYFEVHTPATYTQVRLWLRKVGTPTADLTVQASAYQQPTGVMTLDPATVDSEDIYLQGLNFAGLAILVQDQQMSISVEAGVSDDATNHWEVGCSPDPGSGTNLTFTEPAHDECAFDIYYQILE